MRVICKTKYPSGKIPFGKDLADSVYNFPSTSGAHFAAGFTRKQPRAFTTPREILWASRTASGGDGSQKEVDVVRRYLSSEPAIGYYHRSNAQL
jgi:hypothetical protein